MQLYKQTNDIINKLTHEFAEIRSEVLGSVNALTTSHEEIFISMEQDPPSIELRQISSISNSEQMNNLNNENNNLQKLILQLKNVIEKLKQPVNKTNNESWKISFSHIM